MAYMKLVTAWLLAASVFWLAVPAVGQPGPFSKSALNGESPAAYLERRNAIVADAAAVALDPSEAPLFPGADGRARTALLMVAIARFESGYDLLVDTGKVRGPGGEVCVMQVSVDARYVKGRGLVTAEGWTADELASDRRKCMLAALHKLRVSATICGDAKHPLNAMKRALAGADLLSLYVGRACTVGGAYAAHRFDLAARWAAASAAPVESASAP